jgi:hypothetical protein
MSAMTAPPKLILTLSAPLDGFAVEEDVDPEAVVETADNVVGRDNVGLAEMMEVLVNGDPVESTVTGAVPVLFGPADEVVLAAWADEMEDATEADTEEAELAFELATELAIELETLAMLLDALT